MNKNKELPGNIQEHCLLFLVCPIAAIFVIVQLVIVFWNYLQFRMSNDDLSVTDVIMILIFYLSLSLSRKYFLLVHTHYLTTWLQEFYFQPKKKNSRLIISIIIINIIIIIKFWSIRSVILSLYLFSVFQFNLSFINLIDVFNEWYKKKILSFELSKSEYKISVKIYKNKILTNWYSRRKKNLNLLLHLIHHHLTIEHQADEDKKERERKKTSIIYRIYFLGKKLVWFLIKFPVFIHFFFHSFIPMIDTLFVISHKNQQ